MGWMKIKRDKKEKWLLTGLWCVLIFLGSSLPGAKVSEVELIDFVAHKSVHILEYAILAVLLFRSTGSYWWAFVLSLAFGFTDETHQLFVTNREGKIRDALIDGFGSLISLLLLWKFLPKAPKKLKNWLPK